MVQARPLPRSPACLQGSASGADWGEGSKQAWAGWAAAGLSGRHLARSCPEHLGTEKLNAGRLAPHLLALVGAWTKGGTLSARLLRQTGGKQAGTCWPSGAFFWGFPPRQLGTQCVGAGGPGPHGGAGRATFISFKSCPLALKLWGLGVLAGSSQRMFSWMTAP